MNRIDQNTIRQLTELRHHLHRNPELSNKETGTADIIGGFLEKLEPDILLRKIGGEGVAAVFSGKKPGKSILLRADLDALPIPEMLTIDHGSIHQGVSHKCGHDGHMAILAGIASLLAARRPTSGRVILLFQPAEETGEGAARVLADPQFQTIYPDYVFALHNLPGYRRGDIIVKTNCFAAASTGIIIHYYGKTAHAGEPEKGTSPASAMSQLINSLTALPQNNTTFGDAAKVTVIHARLGERAFGTSPGDAVVMATLRAARDSVINQLEKNCSQLATGVGKTFKLNTSISSTESFPATINNKKMVNIIGKAADTCGIKVTYRDHPFPWSEDFGHFTHAFPGALFGVGAGKNHPSLHHPYYDFPDTLISAGIQIYAGIIELIQNDETIDKNSDQTLQTASD